MAHLGSYQLTAEGWAILVYAPEHEVYLPVSSMVQSTLFWAIGVFGVAILAAVALAGTLSTPLNRLAAASRAFAAGNFSVRVRVRSRTEIGELADTFNRMAAEIEDYIRRLKGAVEEKNELFLGTIRALAQAIDAKDPYTRGHSARVNRYAVVLARQLGLSAARAPRHRRRLAAARRGQDRHRRRDPEEARPPHARGVRGHEDAYHDAVPTIMSQIPKMKRDPPRPAQPPRALEGRRLPGRAGRRARSR